MDKQPQSGRLHVTIFGETNAGKSTLFNAITGTRTAIVSDISGTTTDPVSKSMELLPYGPIVLTDTAGLNDAGALASERLKKTSAVLERTDYAIYAADLNNFDKEAYYELKEKFSQRSIPHKLVFTKTDMLDVDKLRRGVEDFPQAVKISLAGEDSKSIESFKANLAAELEKLNVKEKDLIEGLLQPGSVVLMVTPIDSEAPKGRLILPQAQLIRSCLDNGIRVHVSGLNELEAALKDLQKIDLVVTDSQVFKEVVKIVPEDMPLTSFSILIVRQKADIGEMLNGVQAAAKLEVGDKVLIAESCVHSRGHEDIGQVKIPALLRKLAGGELDLHFTAGKDFPENPAEYKLIVHCGGCMTTVREMQSRIRRSKAAHVPITNYGMLLAYGSGILERSVEICRREGV